MMFKLFKSYSERQIMLLDKIADSVLEKEDEYKALSDTELKNKTKEFKERLKNGETLDDILPDAFATVREASERVLGMRHFKVQIIGGIALHQGRIAQMKTGEGKTLVATLPAYLNALTGKGVTIVTVNDYLAKRDSEWMGKIYKFLGLSVGLIVSQMEFAEKKEAYLCDITYGTNNELGFDYLRDNMAIDRSGIVQRSRNFAIIDEVDSILIDEARTPLIISGYGGESTELYKLADTFAKRLKSIKFASIDDKESTDDLDADYVVDEKASTVTLTARGIKKAEEFFNIENLSDSENMTLAHHINQAIRAYGVMHRDKQYVVKDGEVLIVDEFTGRLMIGRRYSDGLHQAIEAKEGVKVEGENKTLATITFQNYFRLYQKLSGMTGTAKTEEEEFKGIYELDVLEIPTNKPMARTDLPDAIYRTEKSKFEAIANEVEAVHKTGQPVLVGTITIDKSEALSSMLKSRGIKHQVLNAKHHDKEAQIVAQAGKLGAVTIATNMAGRGTDIMLGGNAEYMAKNLMAKKGYTDEKIDNATSFFDTDDEEILNARKVYKDYFDTFKSEISPEHDKVAELGGLYIIGSERHESRRIDDQLRGRSGRQGDPGKTRFYISLEDDLMRIFGGERLENMMGRLIGDVEPLENKLLSNTIESSQKRVEGRNYNSRKYVLQYDDVMNEQRRIIYEQRRQVLDGEDLSDQIKKMIASIIDGALNLYANAPDSSGWNLVGLREYFEEIFNLQGILNYTKEELYQMEREDLKEELERLADMRYKEQEESLTTPIMKALERRHILRSVDIHWMEHIDNMQALKNGITLRAYGQHDPVEEYKFEGFNMFEEMVDNMRIEAIKGLMHSSIKTDTTQKSVVTVTSFSHGDGTSEKKPVKRTEQKIGRNDPCPCGSGKKYKQCCGKS